MSIPQALESLRPGAEWTLIGDTLTWSDTSQTEPTKAEIDAEIVRLEYVRNRREEYPDIADQLDMLWHAIDDNATLKTRYADFHTAIKTVKDANPK